jgi:excisionase family DNA binding protein
MPAANQGLPTLLTVNQTSERLGVSTKHVRRLIANGELPHHRIGRLIRITDADLMAFIRLRRVP